MEPAETAGWTAEDAAVVWGLDLPPASGTWPRFMSARHPRAVGTYGPEFVAWAKRHPEIHPKRTTGLRWFQQLIAYRLLEHDRDGDLVWPTAVLTISRQQGKSWLVRALLMWRLEQHERWGAQTAMSLAHQRKAAEELWRSAARAMKHQPGWTVRFANGQEVIESPYGSRWLLAAANEGAGVSFSLNMVVVDESWQVDQIIVDEFLQPTMAEAESPQMILVSTAGDSDSFLMKQKREAALTEIDNPEDILIIEWSSPTGDLWDRDGWRAASGHWDERRVKTLERAARSLLTVDPPNPAAWQMQWLNRWVGRRTKRSSQFPNWDSLPMVTTPEPPAGCIIAIDESYDSSHAGLAAFHDGQVWYSEHTNAPAAIRAALRWSPREILVGISLRSIAVKHGVANPVPYGAKETALGTPLLIEAVKNGGFAHEHSEALAAQAEGAVTTLSDSGGIRMSVKHSDGSILALKLISWLLLRSRDAIDERPKIWA